MSLKRTLTNRHQMLQRLHLTSPHITSLGQSNVFHDGYLQCCWTNTMPKKQTQNDQRRFLLPFSVVLLLSGLLLSLITSQLPKFPTSPCKISLLNDTLATGGIVSPRRTQWMDRWIAKRQTHSEKQFAGAKAADQEVREDERSGSCCIKEGREWDFCDIDACLGRVGSKKGPRSGIILSTKYGDQQKKGTTERLSQPKTWEGRTEYEVTDPVSLRKDSPIPHPIITDPSPGAWVVSGLCPLGGEFIGLRRATERSTVHPWEKKHKKAGWQGTLAVILPAVHWRVAHPFGNSSLTSSPCSSRSQL